MIFMAEHAQVDEVERRLQCLVPSLQQHEAAADGSVAVVTQALLRLRTWPQHPFFVKRGATDTSRRNAFLSGVDE